MGGVLLLGVLEMTNCLYYYEIQTEFQIKTLEPYPEYNRGQTKAC